MGDLLGVSRSRECDLLSVLLIYSRFFVCVQCVSSHSLTLLGRLPKVDLIILEGGNVHPSVRPSVRPQKVSSISMKFGIQVEVDE